MKISKELLEEGQKLAKKRGYKQLFVNDKGEFFTNKSFAAMSVSYDKEKWAELPLNDGIEHGAEGMGKYTTDLGKSAEVIAAINAATRGDEVTAILKAESAGKNRKSVIDAGNKKLEAIAQAATIPAPEAVSNETTKTSE